MSTDHYTDSVGEISSLFRSRLQMQILQSLAEGNKTLGQLRVITGSSSQALIPKIRILEGHNFITFPNQKYQITLVGRLLINKLQDIALFNAVTKKHKNFWNQHYAEAIPDEFFITIGDLYNSEIIADTNVEIFYVYFNFLNMIQEAKELFILSPISSPAHTDAVMKRISEGIYVETIIGKDLLSQISTSPDFNKIHELGTQTSSKIFVLDDPPKLGLTVSDKNLSLGLFNHDGIYDITTDLFSNDLRAVKWGRKLYQYYRDGAEEVNL